ncbi:MAG TPA: aromatic ring-hydroxylating dioxygenase subunit alpha [Candidatus Sulfotelmatobacter sp.]|nr:aromatic ring-hydroxylating dioxygenase subunit alpha [Candidatus Sulfotelmatobacter sp.]
MSAPGESRLYSGYHKDLNKPDTTELTRVTKGTPCGEVLRRFWHPVMLSRELRDLPKRARILGEDVVLFRNGRGRLGCLDLHCSHRGTSLEFGVVTDRGLSCCYHGWLYDVDGTILETPGEPPSSPIRTQACHGAYPVREHAGLIFGYFGPVEEQPPFFVTDAVARPDNRLHPYYLPFACNWLQSHENAVDPYHSVFLHTRVAGVQFSDAFGILPSTCFRRTELGVLAITARRVGELVWVRVSEDLVPNIAQFGPTWEDGSAEKLFVPPAITRWVVPFDDTSCATIGWRHFNDAVDPDGRGRPEAIGLGTVDFPGQAPDRSYEERQRAPGDYDAQVSQRPIAIHALEHLGTTDLGVALLRQNLRRRIAALQKRERVNDLPVGADGVLNSFAHDTVLRLPKRNEDAAFLDQVRDAVADVTVETWSEPAATRRAVAIRRLEDRGLC